jgi:hypothetical protein
MNNSNISCKDCHERLPDLMLDPASVPAAIEIHVASCTRCGGELASLLATFNALDVWTAPEPSAYFDTRLHARLREAQAASPEGFFERMRSFLTFSTGRTFRPAVSGALALALIVSGGSFIGVHGLHSGAPHQVSAAINDLNVLDNNAAAMQQMDQLLDDSSDDQDATPAT